jgi:YVTN family beta-propeller protein
MPIEFRILGPLELSADGRVLPVGSPKQRALLALLLVHANETVSRDRLIEELWGEAAPASVESAVHSYLSRIRRLLDTAGANGVLVRQPHGYMLRVEPDQLDATRFQALANEGSEALAAGDVEHAAERFRQALGLWRGEALADVQSDGFATAAQARLEEQRLSTLEQRLDADLALGRDRELLSELEALVADHPYQEHLRAQLMLALYRCGRQADALRAYEQARHTLVGELGLEPGHELKQLEQAILQQEPSLSVEQPVRPQMKNQLAEAADAAVGRSRRWTPRKRVWTLAALLVALTGAAVAAGLATHGGAHATVLAANVVGLIDARGNGVRDQVRVDAAPTSVAFGNGAVWVTNAYTGTVSRIDPRTGSVVQTIAVGNSPSGIAVGGGAVWVANHDDGTVSWINPQSNTEVKRIGVGNGPTAVAFGFGSVWVTNSADRTVSRIEARTGNVVKKLIHTNAVGRGIAVGAGSVWVTDESTRTMAEIDPATNRVIDMATVGNGPADITYGAGDLWVANELDDTVSEIDPTTLATRETIPVVGSPSALAFGDGALWVSAEFGQRVVRIDPRTGDKAVIRIGNRPEGLAAVPGGVWVAVQPSGAGHRGGRLVVLGGAFDSIDPAFAGSTDSVSVIGLAYDGLTAFRRVGGSEGTQRVPDLAAALPAPTDGGKSYTFRIRTGIRYSNGTPLQPRDFRRALERMFRLGNPVFEGTALTKIVGASRCKKGRPCDLSRGVIVNGPNSLTFRLTAPDPTFPLLLTGVYPVPRGTPPGKVGTKAIPEAIPSTGPYAIESYAPGRQLTLVRNSYFRSWSQAARPDGYPDEIVWRILTPPKRAKAKAKPSPARRGLQPDEAVREVTDGKADVFFNIVPSNRVQELLSHYPRRLHLIPERATVFVFLNTRRAPFDDIRVRRAFNYAVDREKVADLHGGPALAQPTCQLVPPTVPGYSRFCPYTIDRDGGGNWKAPDLAKARELVAASGTKGERIVLWTWYPFFGKESRYLVSLLRGLGYRARLRSFADLGPYANAIDRTPSVQAGVGGWFGGLVAADMFSTLRCHWVSNWSHFCDPRLDAQVKHLAAVQARDPTAGKALAERIDRELVAKAPWVPLFTPRLADFVSSRVRNYQQNTYASSTVLLDQLWVR